MQLQDGRRVAVRVLPEATVADVKQQLSLTAATSLRLGGAQPGGPTTSSGVALKTPSSNGAVRAPVPSAVPPPSLQRLLFQGTELQPNDTVHCPAHPPRDHTTVSVCLCGIVLVPA